jgi:hypothetical protein
MKKPVLYLPDGEKPSPPRNHPALRPPSTQADPVNRTQMFRQRPSWLDSPPDAEEAVEPDLPRTRYRFGATLPAGRDPGPPPNPSLATPRNETVRAAAAVLRNLSSMQRALATRHMARPPVRATAAVPPSVPEILPDSSHQDD